MGMLQDAVVIRAPWHVSPEVNDSRPLKLREAAPQYERVSRIRHIFRWDLDKTYLKTEFDTVRDLVRTARMPAEVRQNIPGSGALIRAIRDSAPHGFRHQVFFISGSPQQMRNVIERKFALDGFVPDGFTLKPTVGNFFRGRFRAIRNQIAYKLGELISGRAEAPIGTQETLFGDDAESDAYIYSLYSDVVAGDVSPEDLRAVLKKVGAYRDQIEQIDHALEAVVHERPVRRIIIHLDQRTPPAEFQEYFPLLVPIYNHLQTAIVLYMDNTLAPEAIQRVADELIGTYGFDVQRLTNLAEDILRRIRARYPLEHLDRLARDLRALRPPERNERAKSNGAHANGAPEAAAATSSLLAAVADRALYLMSRPILDEPPAPERRRDYIALLEREEARKEGSKRARRQKVQRSEATDMDPGAESVEPT